MKKILALTLFVATALGAFAQTNYFFEPFANATANGGTAYNVGDPLGGQGNGVNFSWGTIGTNYVASNSVFITNYSLTMPTGMPPATGNAVLIRPLTNGPGGRLNIGTNYSTNAATLYYSVVFQVSDVSTLNAASYSHNGGAFNMGFNNTYSTAQNINPTVYGAPLYIGKDGAGGYVIGTGRGTGSQARYWEVLDPTTNTVPYHTTNDVVFAVVEYEIVPGTANDIARLWINPDPATFGADTYPTPTVEVATSSDADLTSLNSFIIANRSTLSPTMVADELRIGYSWAAVTGVPPVQPVVPSLSISLVDPNTVQLSWRGDAAGYSLQGTSTLLSSGTPWAPVAGSTSTSGTNVIQNDGVVGMKFYRLIK
jgi:hypothetical protein